ncbi:hypothetical protein ILUMI_24580 [Ignelater luminosus]|uniref:Uncharacterized protein n=1 Tax=Ignelater luminosus TaxID=2038154 RepID=A0A8K0C6U2_IGNLU|nr:hypothetical protein ILUMI_24580 [Ignelater luminosus]
MNDQLWKVLKGAIKCKPPRRFRSDKGNTNQLKILLLNLQFRNTLQTISRIWACKTNIGHSQQSYELLQVILTSIRESGRFGQGTEKGTVDSLRGGRGNGERFVNKGL